MPTRRGFVHIPGLTAARERAKPFRTPEEVGALLGVDGRTVRRWEEKGWVKIRYVAQLERLYGMSLSEATAPAPRPKAPAVSEGVLTMEDMRGLAALYNARRAQGAPPGELDSLHESLFNAVLAMVTESDSTPPDADDELIDVLTESFVERFTRASQPRAEPMAQQRPATAHARKRRS
jgi:hypothetical protein